MASTLSRPQCVNDLANTHRSLGRRLFCTWQALYSYARKRQDVTEEDDKAAFHYQDTRHSLGHANCNMVMIRKPHESIIHILDLLADGIDGLVAPFQ